MSDRTYTQAEADALIAGAYLACAEHMAGDYNGGEYDWSCRCGAVGHWTLGATDTWEAHIRALTPDAARLALEEREKQLKDELARIYKTNSHNAELYVEAEDKWKRYEREQPAREAKLIADTRLEEAEWWYARYQSHSGVGDPLECSCRGCSRLAAHRAAVQEKPKT